MARMRKYGESKTTRVMMATVPHVISGLGLRKFHADGFFFTRVYFDKIAGGSNYTQFHFRLLINLYIPSPVYSTEQFVQYILTRTKSRWWHTCIFVYKICYCSVCVCVVPLGCLMGTGKSEQSYSHVV